jgi:hypothetical protein
MTRFTFAAFAALATAPLFAGVRIQMENTNLSDNKTSTQTIMLDNTRLRVDADEKTSMMFLTDGGKNRMLILDRTRNEYRVMDEETMKQMAAQVSGAMAQMEAVMKNMTPEQRKMMEQAMKGKMPQAAAAAPKTVYTAKGSGTVNGFSCTKYDGMQGATKVADICAAAPSQIKVTPNDFQVFEKMKQFFAGMMDTMKNSPFGSGMQSSFADAGFEGFPVQRIGFRNGQPADRMEVKSIANTNFSDADFSVGAAKKVDIPGLAGGRGK